MWLVVTLIAIVAAVRAVARVIQFFMTDQSLFILVIDVSVRLQLHRIRFWLDSIRFRTKQHQSTMIVASKCNSVPETNTLCERLDQIRQCIRDTNSTSWIRGDIIEADFKFNLGTDDIRQRLMQAAPEIVSSWGLSQPLKWLRLEELIRNESLKYRPLQSTTGACSHQQTGGCAAPNALPSTVHERSSGYLTLDQIKSIATSVKCAMTECEVPAALKFLRDIGSIVHFDQDNCETLALQPQPEQRLRDYVFCSAQWLVDVLKCVVNLEHKFKRMRTRREQLQRVGEFWHRGFGTD
jgi:hypothetical protein